MSWPIDDPALIERLTLDHEAFAGLMDGFVDALKLPPYDEAFYERAVAYPWSRPAGSYALDGDEVLPLGASPTAGWTHAARKPSGLRGSNQSSRAAGRADREAGAGPDRRVPLLAIGSNGAPSTLVRKFAHLPPQERRLVVVAGRLRGYDVGPAARVTPYGSLPATLFASPGTAVRASVLWVTSAQLTMLTWSEMSYFLGWLSPAAFEPDAPESETGTPPVTQALVYVSRWGTLTDGAGAPLALEALAAEGRTAAAWSQAGLLDLLAERGGTGAADGRALLSQLCDRPAAFMRALHPWLTAHSAPLATDAWHPYPAEPPAA